MARMAVTTVMAIVVAVAMAVRMPMEATAMTCAEVDLDLLLCLSYIRDGGDVPSDCCNGLFNLVNTAKTTDDRRTACSCLKNLASMASDDKLDRAAVLPDKCGVSLTYKISRDTDCYNVN